MVKVKVETEINERYEFEKGDKKIIINIVDGYMEGLEYENDRLWICVHEHEPIEKKREAKVINSILDFIEADMKRW